MLKKFKNINLPSFLWFFFPILFFFIILFTKYFYLNFFVNFFQSEKGIIENGTFVLLIISIILSFCILKNKNLFIFILRFFITQCSKIAEFFLICARNFFFFKNLFKFIQDIYNSFSCFKIFYIFYFF